MKKLFWLILMVIVIFSAYLRLVDLDKNPPHLGNDEISIAYDSYSIRMIGKDEHGHSWPLSFQSHNDYKAPLYAYLNIPINYILGNNEYGVRVLSVLASLVSIVFIALLGKEMGNLGIGIVAAFLLGLNPKNIFASRISFESNLAAMFVLVGFWCLVKLWKEKRNIYGVLLGLFWGLSVWAYHTERGLIPIMVIVFSLLSRKNISIRKLVVFWTTLLVVVLPIFYDFINLTLTNSNGRANTQIWFKGPGSEDFYNNSNVGLVKKILVLVLGPIHNYLAHFSFDNNFTSGTNLFNQREPLDVGWFLLATLPILIVGLVNVKNIFGKWWKGLIVFWLVCPVIPALTFGGVASVRNLVFLFPTILIMAGGWWNLYKKYGMVAKVIVFLILINFIVFSRAYYVFYPITSGNNFQYGYKQAWEFIKPNIDKYERVVVEDRFGEFGQFTGVPHLYFGYFGAFTSEEMQLRHDGGGLAIGKYRFKYVDWNKEVYFPKTVYIVSAINPIVGHLRDKFKEVGMIRNTDFKQQFLIYETKDLDN